MMRGETSQQSTANMAPKVDDKSDEGTMESPDNMSVESSVPGDKGAAEQAPKKYDQEELVLAVQDQAKRLVALGTEMLQGGRDDAASEADSSIHGSIVFQHHTSEKKKKGGIFRSLRRSLSSNQKEGTKKKHWKPLVSYEAFMWTWFVVLSTLAIIDRFIWNVWPRQTYSIGAGFAGSDQLEGLKPGPWSVVLYDVVARISGRYSILAYNFLLMTRLESLEWFLTNSFVSKYLLDCSNIVNANIRMHTWNGIALCVLTLLHVWSILFPCVTHGYSAVMVRGTFEWPISERKPVKCSKEDVPGCWPGDANIEMEQMGLQVDDVFRLVEMTVFLLILMPVSVRWLARRWHAGIFLHRVINVVYFVDIVRRHTHPHSWILNTPVFCYYLFDKFIWGNYWRRNNGPPVKKVTLGEDFMVLYWYSPFGLTNEVGPDYSLLLHNSSFLENKHVFTCFENRSGSVLGDESDGFKWNVGVVIRVFRQKRTPRLGKKDAYSHTMRMYNEDPNLLIVGPRQGEMSQMVKASLLEQDSKPLVLLGAGSAINFIIDCLQWCIQNDPGRSAISLVYTTRDYDLFYWVKDVISVLLPRVEEKGIECDVWIAFTGIADHRSDGWFETVQDESTQIGVKAQDSRIDLHNVILPGATVYCQGSAGLKNAVSSVCRKTKAKFYGGRGGAREDIAEKKI